MTLNIHNEATCIKSVLYYMHLNVYVFDMNDFNFNDKSKTDKQEIAQFSDIE